MKQMLRMPIICSVLVLLILGITYSAITSLSANNNVNKSVMTTTAVGPIDKAAPNTPKKVATPQGTLPTSEITTQETGLSVKSDKNAPLESVTGLHPLGLIPSSLRPELYHGMQPDLSSPETPESLPSSVNLSAGLPPVGDQGTQGACVAFSVGYYYKTYQEYREYAWDTNASSHQFSPSFLYNQVAPFNEGMTFDEAFNTLMDKGCATLTDCPFIESDFTTWPSYTAFLNGIPHRIQSYTKLGDGTTAGIIDSMKSQLATGGEQGTGDLCLVGFPVYRPSSTEPGRFDQLSTTDYYYDGPAVSDTFNAGYHALAIIGYDDAAFDGRGGFKVVNSWGTGWGNSGYAYISYQFVESYATDVYIMQDRIGYEPTATAHFALSHSFWGWNYDNVTVTIGVGPTNAPLWSKVFITGLEREALAVDMAVDITDGVGYGSPTFDNKWWIRIDDNSREDVANLTVFDVQFGATPYSASVVMPLNGPFFAGSLYAFCPAGEAASNHYYVSTTGNDSNDGLSASSPKRSVQAIIDRYTLKSGDIVSIGPGMYALTSDIVITQLDRGTNGNPIRFVGAIDGNGEPATIFDRGGADGSCFTLNSCAMGIQLENLTINRGANGVYYDGSWQYSGDSLSMNNMRFKDSGYPCYLWEAQNVRLDHCILSPFTGPYAVTAIRSTVSLNACVIATSADRTCITAISSSSNYWSNAYVSLTNSILTGGSCVNLGRAEYSYVTAARYNDLFVTDGGTIGFTPDSSNLMVDPKFFDAPNGDFHLMSTTGRWDPSSSAWVLDSEDSPCIDAGDITANYSNEPMPNGSRVNIGAYGGTPWASKSNSNRGVQILSPNGGEVWNGIHSVTWAAWGSEWEPGETVKLEYWNGSTWNLLDDSSGTVPYGACTYLWDTAIASQTPGPHFLVRVTSNASPSVTDQSDAVFTIAAKYYVNDSSAVDDVYCTAVGNDANDGNTPSTPKATLQALLDAKNIEPGDVVYVDTGLYHLVSDITIGADDSGSALANVSFKGSPNGTILDRGTNGGSCIVHSVRCVSIEGFTLRGGAYAIRQTSNGYGPILLRNNIFERNADTGVYIYRGDVTLLNNTFYEPGSDAVYGGSASFTIRNNSFVVSGLGKVCIRLENVWADPMAYGHDYDYNNYFVSSGAGVGYYGSFRGNLATWREVIPTVDIYSISVDPLFADPANGDFHEKSQVGRYDPVAGEWVTTDTATSMTIDTGDPSVASDVEPEPNGGRLNQGAYGGTAQASKSPAGRLLLLLTPNGGEVLKGVAIVRWVYQGVDIQDSDRISLSYSPDNGSTWLAIAGAESLPIKDCSFAWDTTIAVPNYGVHFRLRAEFVNKTHFSDDSDGCFTLHNHSISYYVNDSSTFNDVYCTAVGNDANYGTSVDSPKATLQAILSTYRLLPGDTVYVDTGLYSLSGDITIGSEDSGDATGYVAFKGSPNGTILDRGASGSCIVHSVRCVSIEGFTLRGGAYAIRQTSNGYGPILLRNNIFERNADTGVYIYRGGVTLLNNTFYEPGSNAVWGGSTGFIIRNNIFDVSGAGKYCIGLADVWADPMAYGHDYDYNDYFVSDGAGVGYYNSLCENLTAWREVIPTVDIHSISVDPLFADPANGDFHEKSSAGRWDPDADSWVLDSEDSPCIDAGDPETLYGYEPRPNGNRINIGAYGNTNEASKSRAGRPDLLIKTGLESSYSGIDVFSVDGNNQTKSQSASPGQKPIYAFKVKNAGNKSDSLRITGPAGSNGWSVKYYDLTSGADVTSLVTGAGWMSAILAPGASAGIYAKVIPSPAVSIGAVNTLVISASANDDTRIDVVKAVTTFVGTYKTDMILKAGSETSYTGTGIFNTDGTSQTKSLNVCSAQKVSYTFRAQNAGNANDSFRITGTAGGSGWSVRYYDIATNIEVTSQVTGAGWVSPTLAPKGSSGVYANVRPDASVPLGSTITLIITGSSESDNTKIDIVKAVTTCVAAYKPDLLIKSSSEPSYIGTDIINTDGTNQTKSQPASVGQKVTYSFRVKNAGYLSDSIRITGTSGGSGWSVRYYDMASVEITSQVTGSGWSSGTLAPGVDRGFFVKVSPDATVASGASKTLLIMATSVGDGTKQDVVKAVTTVP